MGPDEEKSKEQLIEELRRLRRQVKDLEASETELKHAKEELEASASKYRVLFESSPDAILMIEEGKNLDCNKAALDIFMFQSKEEFRNAPTQSLSPEIQPDGKESGELMRRHLDTAYEKGSDTYEWMHQRKDGRPFPSEVVLNKITIGDRDILQAIVRDITDRKKAEEALREREAQYRGIFNSATDTLLILDLFGNIVEANPQACEMYGYAHEDLIRLRGRDLVHPDYHPLSKKLREDITAKGHFRDEFVEVKKDGSNIDVEVRVTEFDYKGEKHLLAIVRDISARKQAEKERQELHAQLEHAQKMQAIGTLAGGIAHDFNNLLTGIQGQVSLMAISLDREHPHYEYLKGIEEIVKRGAELTSQLLGFARGGKYEVQVTDLNSLVSMSSDMFGRTKKEIRIHRAFQPDLWTVEVDRGQIEQVLLNLYVNAWHAMPNGGDLSLETTNEILDEKAVAPFEGKPGKYVKVALTDTGEGMDEETQRRVFEPFFTTKKMGMGTGLGLASAYGIVTNHGGMISVTSKKGEGSTFNLYFPASQKKVRRDHKTSEIILGGDETVLLVDDETMILKIGKRILSSLGYTVLTAQGGREAVEIYKKEQSAIHIVVLDMIMPDQGGGEAYDRIKQINPNAKVLLSSGYSLDGQASTILQRGCNGFIQKPFNIKQLSQKMREVLDAR